MTVELPRWTLADRLTVALVVAAGIVVEVVAAGQDRGYQRCRGGRRGRPAVVACAPPRAVARWPWSSGRRVAVLLPACRAAIPARYMVLPASSGRASCCTGRRPLAAGRGCGSRHSTCRVAPAPAGGPAGHAGERLRRERSATRGDGSMTAMANFPPVDGSTEPHEPAGRCCAARRRSRPERSGARRGGSSEASAARSTCWSSGTSTRSSSWWRACCGTPRKPRTSPRRPS